MDKQTAYSNFHSQLEARLASLETNAFTFVAVVASVFLGLGYVYSSNPTLPKIFFASVGALLALGFGVLYIQATAHAFRSVQVVMWKLENSSELDLARQIPKAWDPTWSITRRRFWWHIPEMLFIQFLFYLTLAGGVFVLGGFWIYRQSSFNAPHSDLLLWPYYAMALAGLSLVIICFFIWRNYILIEKQHRLVSNELPSEPKTKAVPLSLLGVTIDLMGTLLLAASTKIVPVTQVYGQRMELGGREIELPIINACAFYGGMALLFIGFILIFIDQFILWRSRRNSNG